MEIVHTQFLQISIDTLPTSVAAIRRNAIACGRSVMKVTNWLTQISFNSRLGVIDSAVRPSVRLSVRPSFHPLQACTYTLHIVEAGVGGLSG